MQNAAKILSGSAPSTGKPYKYAYLLDFLKRCDELRQTYSSVSAPVMPEDSQQTVEDEASVEPTSGGADERTRRSSRPTACAAVPGALAHGLDRLGTAERTGRRRSSDYGELAGATQETFIQVDEKLKSMNSQIQNLIKSMEEKRSIG